MDILTDTSTLIDYFTEDGLLKKTGLTKNDWNLMIFKELVDNSLDATEVLPDKRIEINYDYRSRCLQIFDNGPGLSDGSIHNSIYDFSVYHSSKRHYITPSRGQQGAGLKTIISACFLLEYGLFWHTSEGYRVQYSINADGVSMGGLPLVEQISKAPSDKHGVEIIGIFVSGLEFCIEQYAACNPDTTFIFTHNGRERTFPATAAACNKSDGTHISFYDVETIAELAQRQLTDKTYKQFLAEAFGTRVSNKTQIRGKIGGIDFRSQAFRDDFQGLRNSQEKKKFTVLKPHMIGLPYSLEASDNQTGLPYIVEMDVVPLDNKQDGLSCSVMINNSITFEDAYSVSFKSGSYKIGSRKANNSSWLYGLLEPYTDYAFTFHFICPRPVFKDGGKTKIDISNIMEPFVDSLKKAISKAKRTAPRTEKVSKRDIMRYYLPEAYQIASTGGKYSITARQIFYKLRELSGIEETSSLYNDFTQTVLTEWLEENPEAESKVYFSDRGNYVINGKVSGIGTASVRKEILADQQRNNLFRMIGGTSEQLSLQADFSMLFTHTSVLYIEKTGFNDVFRAEGIEQKHNMIIVSGQGFGTRAAKELLKYCEGRTLDIFCMHDLDYSGVNILESLRNGNEKFRENIRVHDFGITLDDVEMYGIEPEQVRITDRNRNIDFSKYTEEQRNFFLKNRGRGYYQRVELNAFTTQQILEIIDRKLKYVPDLPKVVPADVIEIDRDKIRKAAFVKVMLEKYGPMLDNITVPELPEMDVMTVPEIQQAAGGIIEELIHGCEQQIRQKI